MNATADPRALPANSAILRSKELQRMRRVLRLAERVSPRLAARLAGELFRRPRRHTRPDREHEWTSTGRRLRISYAPPPGAGRSAARELSALSWGEGPTVLLQHGWEGRASQMGAFAQPLVARGLRVVALDAPAHGESQGRTSSMIEFAVGLRAAAQAFGPLRGVVGHSLGAAATAAAVSAGLEVERLVFIAPPFDLDVYFALFLGMLGLGQDVHDHMIQGYERQFGLSWSELRRVTVDGSGPHPLLVVHDRDDQETPFVGAQAVTASWPNGRLHATNGLGHLRVLRSSKVVQEVVQHLVEPLAETELPHSLQA